VTESRRTLTFDEFFADPMRVVSEPSRKAMIQVARVPPVQLIALIDYEAQSFVGAIIRERATCTFNSLEGTDAPTRTYWVMIDGEYNTAWAARQPNAAAVQLRVFKEQWRGETPSADLAASRAAMTGRSLYSARPPE
jgi:hypothetical protein